MKCENGEKKRKFVMRKFVTVVEIVTMVISGVTTSPNARLDRHLTTRYG